MISNRYVALLAGTHNQDSGANQFYSAILNYLDDRHWPVSVWYHNRRSTWVQHNKVLSAVYYGIKLCVTPKSTLVVEACLLTYLSGALWFAKAIRHHNVIISLRGGTHPRMRKKRRYWKRVLKIAHLLIVDSEITREQLMDVGLDTEWVRVLPEVKDLDSLTYQHQTANGSLKKSEIFERASSLHTPDSLEEAIDQLDMKSDLLQASQRRLN